MTPWWYKLVGDDTRYPWAVDTNFPAGTDYSDAAFINQFIDRLNIRLAASTANGISLMDRVSPGDSQLTAAPNGDFTSLIKTFCTKIRMLGNLWVGPEDPDGIEDSSSNYIPVTSHSTFNTLTNYLLGLGAGVEFDAQLWMRHMRDVLQFASSFLVYSWEVSSFMHGTVETHFKESPDIDFSFDYDIQNPTYPDDPPRDWVVPVPGGLFYQGDGEGLYRSGAAQLVDGYISFGSRGVDFAANVVLLAKGERYGSTYESAEFPDEGYLYAIGSRSGNLETGNDNRIDVDSLGVASALGDQGADNFGYITSGFKVVLKIDEENTPDIE